MTNRWTTILSLLIMLIAVPAIAQSTAMTPASLQKALSGKPKGKNADLLADQIRQYFGENNLDKGADPKVDELIVAWAINAPDLKDAPEVTASDGSFHLTLQRVGKTDLYSAVTTLPEASGFIWQYVVNGQVTRSGNLEVYTTPPDDLLQPNVPHGTLTQKDPWKSQIFAGTSRNWWVYVPAQYTSDKPACVMIFQDGGGYKNYIPTVFDNLIAKGKMPITVGIFIDPGTFADGRSDRSFEYDTLSDQYSRFLMEEILPEVEKTVQLRTDAPSRAIGGISSGGICAWTVAWQHPDQFSKVLSWVGSFTDIAAGDSGIAGGHNYPFMIRRTPKKPIRIFMQDGANDLDNQAGSWPLSAQQMAAALAFAGYDYKFVYGHGFHSDRYGRALLPDSLTWLWRDYKP